MGVYWLRAEESVAAVIARSESRGVYDWPSLSMQALKPSELAALWNILVSATGDAGARTGLGLAICKSIAMAHKGIIRYSPGPQGGALYELLLPAKSAKDHTG